MAEIRRKKRLEWEIDEARIREARKRAFGRVYTMVSDLPDHEKYEYYTDSKEESNEQKHGMEGKEERSEGLTRRSIIGGPSISGQGILRRRPKSFADQGMKWYTESMKIDSDGDQAHEFIVV